MDTGAEGSTAEDRLHELVQDLFCTVSDSLDGDFLRNPERAEAVRHQLLIDVEAVRGAFEDRRNERRKAAERQRLEEIDQQLKRSIIRNFIEQHFAGATPDEVAYIVNWAVQEYDGGEEFTDWDHCLRTFLKDGISGVRRQRAKDRRKRVFSRTRRVAWQLIKGLLAIAVVLSVYSTVSTTFETIVVSLLVIMYTAISIHGSAGYVRHVSDVVKMDKMFVDMKETVGKPVSFDIREAVRIFEDKTVDEQFSAMTFQIMLGLVDLIALWNLLRVTVLA